MKKQTLILMGALLIALQSTAAWAESSETNSAPAPAAAEDSDMVYFGDDTFDYPETEAQPAAPVVTDSEESTGEDYSE